MAKRDEDLQKKIREAAEEGRIEFADSYVVEEYDEIAIDFFNIIFALDYTECFVSDESSLSDFATCCVLDEEVKDDLVDLLEEGKRNMVAMIKLHYGIDVDAYDTLIVAFEKIKQSQNRKLN